MKLAGSLEKAQAIGPGQHKAAAGLYNDIEQELEHGGYTEEESDEADQALAHLEANHPGVRQTAHQITRPPNLSRRAKQGMDSPLHATTPEQHRRQRRQPGRGARQRVASATAIHARRRGGRGPSFGSAVDAIPGSGTISQLLMRTLGGVAGLSFLYVLLTPKGSGAVSLASKGATDVLRVLASPTVDPLRPAAARAAARPAPQPSLPAIAGQAVFPRVTVINPRFHSVPGHRP